MVTMPFTGSGATGSSPAIFLGMGSVSGKYESGGMEGYVLPAIGISVVSVAAFLIMPILVGTVASHFALNESEAGYFASAVMGGSALASLCSIFWVRRVHWRLALRLSMGLMLAGLALSLISDSIITFTAAQCLVSLGGGSAYSLALTILSDSPRAERYFGYSVACQVGFQVIGLLLLPTLIAGYGISGLLLTLLALTLLALVAVSSVPAAGKPVEDVHSTHAILRPASLLALFGCFFFFFNVGCYWAYIELMGRDAGLQAETVGNLLALGVSMGILGALAASWSEERFGLLKPLAIGALGTCLAVLVLGDAFTALEFGVSVAIYNLVWNLSLAFQYTAVARVDHTGSSVAAAPAFHAVGGAVGPAVAGLLFPLMGFLAVNMLVATSVLLSFACFFGALSLYRREPVNG